MCGTQKTYANQPICQSQASFPVPESQAGDPVTTTTLNPCVEVFYQFFLSVGFHGALKKRHFTENNVGVGGEREFHNA